MELLRLYQTVQWLAEGADPKDRGAGDALVTLAAEALMASRHLQPDRPAVMRRLLQVRSISLPLGLLPSPCSAQRQYRPAMRSIETPALTLVPAKAAGTPCP